MVESSGRVKLILDIVASIVMIGVSVTLVGLAVARNGTVRSSSPTEPPLPSVPVSLDGTRLVGDPAAKAVVIAYLDYECPYCGRFERDTWPTVRERYVDSRKLLFAVHHYPLAELHTSALDAAEMAECAGDQGKFWEAHSLLLENTTRVKELTPLVLSKELRLDRRALVTCLQQPGERRILQGVEAAKPLKVGGTPTFFFGVVVSPGTARITSRMEGAVSFSQFEDRLNKLFLEVASTGPSQRE